MAAIWSDLYSLKKKYKNLLLENMRSPLRMYLYSIPIQFFCFVAISVLRRFNLAFMEAYQIYIFYMIFTVIYLFYVRDYFIRFFC